MGVVTVTGIDYGHIYGPLPHNDNDVISHVGLITCLPRTKTQTFHIDLNDTSDCNNHAWMYEVTAARNEDEQNMEAYVKGGQVYYRCLRMIREQEELLVWYSKDLCLTIGILEIPRHKLVEKHELICPLCGEIFSEPFPLRAHVRFKCALNSKNLTGCESITSFGNSEVSKRKRRLSGDCDENNSKEICKKSALDESDLCVNDGSVEVDVNQNIRMDRDTNSQSAFTKVSKTPSQNENLAIESFASQQFFSTMPFSATSNNTSNAFGQYQSPSNSFNTSLPILPMLSSLGMQRFMKYMTREGSVSDRVSMNHRETLITLDRDVFHKAIHMTHSTALNRNLTKLPVARDKATSFPFIRTTNPMVDKLLQSISPGVAHLPLAAIPMTQNWCAQCNATFRMTSDLVYHMRSHHQREFDPIKKKREDKLRCGVCHEGFRERHHLTRHMTSHL